MKSCKKFLIISQALLLLVSLVFNVHASQQKPIKLVYATFFSITHKQTQLCEAWAKEIEKRTQGKLKITFFPSGTYFHGDEIYEGVVFGAVDIGMSKGSLRRSTRSGSASMLRHGIPAMRKDGSLPSVWATRSSNFPKMKAIDGARLSSRLLMRM